MIWNKKLTTQHQLTKHEEKEATRFQHFTVLCLHDLAELLLARADLWGSGVEGVFAQRCVYVRNRFRSFSQLFAAVRNRPSEGHMAVPMVSSAEGVILEVSNVALLRFAAGVALRDI